MEHFHLTWIIFFEPFVLADAVVDEADGEFTVDLHGSLSPLLAVEPGFRPPVDAVLVGIDADEALDVVDAVLVGIDADEALDVETLDVDVEAVERIDEALSVYGVVNSFFFSISVMEERNTPCMSAR